MWEGALVRGVMEQLALLGIVLSFSSGEKPLRRGRCRRLVGGSDEVYDCRQFPEPEWSVLAAGNGIFGCAYEG